MVKVIAIGGLLLSFFLTSVSAQGHVWWEAEDAIRHDWPDKGVNGIFAPKNEQEADKLSGGAWLNTDKPEGLHARYEIQVPADGSYRFWARRFWNFGPFTWSIDGSEPVVVEKPYIFNSVEVRPLLTASWISAGEDIKLAAGKHSIEIVCLPPARPGQPAAFDCFCLSADDWYPAGKYKPDATLPPAPEGHWTFPLRVDPMSDEALLDLRGLNEAVAGQSGRVRLSPDGNDMLLGDGRLARFWALSINSMGIPDRDLAVFARFQAKMGVNLARLFQFQPGTPHEADPEAISQRQLEDWWRYVAALKKEGIYGVICPYWSHVMKAHENWGLPGTMKHGGLYGLLYYHERMQELYYTWVEKLMTEPNPHTGIPLAKDPALAIFQINNEDSLFWWSALRGFPIAWQRPLGKRYGQWLTEKYGSLDQALVAWGGDEARLNGPEDRLLQDHFEEGIAGIQDVFSMTSKYQAEHADEPLERRSQDQIAFLASLQRDFYEKTQRFLRERCGYEGLVSACNWYTADAGSLTDVERWTYDANDVVAKNIYVHLEHINPESPGWESHSIRTGDFFRDQSVLEDMARLPIAIRQVSGHPSMITESNWNQPGTWRGEGPFLIACYGSLIGFDSFQWFHPRGIQYDTVFSKWQNGDPSNMGTWPAAALLYRQGYVQTAEATVIESRSEADLWAKKASRVVESKTFDPIYAADRATAESKGGDQADIPWPAFLTGPVQVDFKGEGFQSADLDSLIDLQAGQVRSQTGELFWDWKRQVCTVDAPRAQGACGFLGKHGALELGDMQIVCENSYATVLAVPLDEMPLAESQRILIQCTTVSRPHGYKTEEVRFDMAQVRENAIAKRQKRDPKQLSDHSIDGLQITDLGQIPWVVEDNHLRISLRNPVIDTATGLDIYGYAAGAIPLHREGDTVMLDMPEDAMWVILSVGSAR